MRNKFLLPQRFFIPAAVLAAAGHIAVNTRQRHIELVSGIKRHLQVDTAADMATNGPRERIQRYGCSTKRGPLSRPANSPHDQSDTNNWKQKTQ